MSTIKEPEYMGEEKEEFGEMEQVIDLTQRDDEEEDEEEFRQEELEHAKNSHLNFGEKEKLKKN